MKQIKILGAGPAGLSAAINLAKAGYKVDVFEKNSDVGMRFHGDLQGLENWSETKNVVQDFKDMGIKINFDCDPFSKVILSNGDSMAETHLDKPMFYLVKRGSMYQSLDQGLKRQALAEGVRIHFGRRLDESEADIVGAGPRLKEVAAVDKGIIFKTSMKDMAISLVNDKAAYKGYSYLLVTKGYGCMCTVLFDKFSQVKTCFGDTKNMFNRMLKLDIQDPKEVGGVESFSIKNVFRKGKTLYVGEAAGLQDLLWGFGIRTAVTSGFLAAKSVIEELNYEELVKKRFSRKLKASLVNRFLWENFNGKNYGWMMRKSVKIKDPFHYLYYTHNYAFFQKLLYPFARVYMRKRYPQLKL